MRVRALAVVAALLVVGVVVWSQSQAPVFPDARASDPIAMGWMVGSPPPADKLVRFATAASPVPADALGLLAHARTGADGRGPRGAGRVRCHAPTRNISTP